MTRTVEPPRRPVAETPVRAAAPARVRLRRTPEWMARAVWLLGLISLVSALVPGLRGRLSFVRELLPAFVPAVATAATLAAGLTLMAVAGGLRRRKRHAWWLAIALSAASAVLHLAKGLDVEEAALSALVLALLVLTRDRFTAAADPRRRWPALAGVALIPLAALGAGTGYLALHQRALTGTAGPRGLLTEAAAGLLGLGGPLGFRSVAAADRTAVVLGTLGLLALVGVVLTVLRSAPPDRAGQAARDRGLRALVAAEGGRDSLAYFALREDKSVVFSPTGKAAIAYRVIGGVSLAAGDPLGDAEAWPGAIDAWLAQAREHAWIAAVLGAGERAATVYTRHGLDALELGDEALLDTATFTLAGREMRAVRQAVNRVARLGVTAVISRAGDTPPAVLDQARAAAVGWRGSHTERGFSMALGRFGDPSDPECVVVRAVDRDGALVGLLHLVPWGRDGLSLDLMRRRRDTGNGLVEFLVAELMRVAPELGVRRVSLNFAVFRSVFARGERVGAGPVLRLWRRLLLGASRWWQIESLYRSNAKFRPEWQPRFLCFPAARDLPRITLAALRAEAFVTAPGVLGGHRPLR